MRIIPDGELFQLWGNDWRIQWRGEGTYFLSEAFNVTVGSELQRFNYKQNLDTLGYQFDETMVAGYLEGEWKPGKTLCPQTRTSL